LMACEYGPIAFGALGVETASRVKLIGPPWKQATEYFKR
jgi:hypothetical protein